LRCDRQITSVRIIDRTIMAKNNNKKLENRNDGVENSEVNNSAILTAFKKMAEIVMWLFHVQPKSAEGYLKFLDYICSIIGIGYFVNLFMKEWQKDGLSWTAILIFLIGVIFYLSRLSVKQELDIAKTLFSPDCVPDELQLKDRFTITIQVTSFMALYWFLGYVAQYISLASFSMLLIACNDFITRRKINDNFHQYLSNSKYAPSKSERNYKAIQSRRKEVKWFLFGLPHLRKEACRVAGCAVAFGLAAYVFYKDGDALINSLYSIFIINNLDILQAIIESKRVFLGFLGKHQGESFNDYAYIIMIITLMLNEIISIWWRKERDRRLGILKL
jgi:hypothetical protein